MLFCGCCAELHKGVYTSDKHTIEVASNATLQIDGKDCIHYSIHPDNVLQAIVAGAEVDYYVEVPSMQKFVLTAKSTVIEHDISGVYVRQEEDDPAPIKLNEIEKLKAKQKSYVSKLEKLDGVLWTMGTQIAAKTKSLRDLGIKTSADIKNAETKRIAQSLVSMTKDREKLAKTREIISAKLSEIDHGIEQLEARTVEISDKELEELLGNIADKQSKTPIESIESNDILEKALN